LPIKSRHVATVSLAIKRIEVDLGPQSRGQSGTPEFEDAVNAGGVDPPKDFVACQSVKSAAT
jgi:hypothetical protein